MARGFRELTIVSRWEIGRVNKDFDGGENIAYRVDEDGKKGSIGGNLERDLRKKTIVYKSFTTNSDLHLNERYFSITILRKLISLPVKS